MFTTVQPHYSAGELTPELFGRIDLAKWHFGASTLRNFFVNYRGGVSTRAGTAYVGMCKQPGTSAPPRDIRFQFNLNQGYALEFGDNYMRIKSNGAYVIEDPINITNITQSNPVVVTTSSAHGYSAGDWVYMSAIKGMTQLNGLTNIISTVGTTTFSLTNLFSSAISSTGFTAYSSGGTTARIYTLLTTYAAADVPALKYVQSADTMSLVHSSYAPYDLKRLGATNWTLTQVTFGSLLAPPASVSAACSVTTASNQTQYKYIVTACNSNTGDESIASGSVGTISNAVDISATAGCNTITWSASTSSSVDSYKIYRAPQAYNTSVPSGSLYGYVGTATGTAFVDQNIVPDWTTVPPTHQNPFPSANNYPGCVAYFQQRRVYANTNNSPNTYWMSKPGVYLNMDTTIPINDGDAIVGTPWAQQINGIQSLIPMPGGLVIFSGWGMWQLNGGSQNSAITPSNQIAAPQAYTGCNDKLMPIVVNYDILFVQSKGSIIRDLAYNFFVNIYTGTDMTLLSSHMFIGHTIQSWAWAEEPYKIVWCVREDGILLSFTFLKEQDIYGWARHDTNGLYQSVITVTEPPVDGVYLIVKRYINGNWYYYSERMDNRLWTDVENAWCSDCALQYPLTKPNSTLYASAANGTSNITGVTLVSGGINYSTGVTVAAVDPLLSGAGAVFTVTVSSGVIQTVTPSVSGSSYSVGTYLTFTDATGHGSGAIAVPLITNIINFTTNPGVFSSGNVGDVIRMGGGKATITSFVSSVSVMADLGFTPIVNTVPNSSDNMPIPATYGNWSMTTPVSAVSGLNHLEGKTVSILGDGSVQTQQVVSGGRVTLDSPASNIIVGLPYTCRFQSLYLEPVGTNGMTQGKRKNIQAVTVRVQNSRGFFMGTNQVDASTLPGGYEPEWTGLKEYKPRVATVYAGQAIPLFTGDIRMLVTGDWAVPGQIAIETSYPLPLNILGLIPEFNVGDTQG